MLKKCLKALYNDVRKYTYINKLLKPIKTEVINSNMPF